MNKIGNNCPKDCSFVGDQIFSSICNSFFAGPKCPKPDDVPGACIESVMDRAKMSFPHDTKLVYICQPGRKMTGESAERTCVSGTWTDVKFKCESKFIHI